MTFAGGMGDFSWYADPDEMAGWAETAPAGATFVYAKAAALPKGSEVSAAAKALSAQGLVELNLRREGGRLNYLLRRVQQRVDARPMTARAMNGKDARLYRLLADCAAAGWDCPTNPDLARAAGLKSAQQASYHIHRLITLGKVERQIFADGTRAIRIAATGEFTKGWIAEAVTSCVEGEGDDDD